MIIQIEVLMMIQTVALKALRDNYIWMVVNPHDSTCIAVDPGASAPVITFLQRHQLRLSTILVTHHHPDHTQGIPDLLDQEPLIIGSAHSTCPYINRKIQEGQQVHLPQMNLILRAFETPGHTLCHISFLIENQLFTGDTLFSAGCGRIFEGTPSMMYHSLQKLIQLPDDTKIYCGHEYTQQNLVFASHVEPHNLIIKDRLAWAKTQQNTLPSTLAYERHINPFLRSDHPDVIQAAQTYNPETTRDPIDVLSTLRTWKNEFKPDLLP